MVCKALGLNVSFFTIPTTIIELNIFVDPYYNFYSKSMLVVQERKSCVNFLAE